MDRRVLWIDLDDVGRELLAGAVASGGAPSIGRAMAAGMTWSTHWAAPLCSMFRARSMTGLDAYRPGNLVGRNVLPGDAFAGPSGTWVAEGLSGTSVKIGKVHMTGSASFPGVMVQRGWDRFVGTQANLGAGGYYDWLEHWSDGSGSGSSWQTQHNTTRLAGHALAEIALGTEVVHVSFSAVHEPLELPPDGEPSGVVYSGSTAEEIKAAMLFHLDYWVGELIAAAVPAGYVVVIVCDNGTAMDGKGTYYEAGINTNLIVLGQGVRSGVSERLVQATDLWAVVRRLRGWTPSVATPVAADAVDFTDDFMAVPQIAAPREFLTCDRFQSLGAQPDPSAWSRFIRNARWKYVDNSGVAAPVGTPVFALFDLETDPTEAVNLLDAPLSSEAQAAYDLLLANLPN